MTPEERLEKLERALAAAKRRNIQLLAGMGLAVGLLVGTCALRSAGRKPPLPPAAPKTAQAPTAPKAVQVQATPKMAIRECNDNVAYYLSLCFDTGDGSFASHQVEVRAFANLLALAADKTLPPVCRAYATAAVRAARANRTLHQVFAVQNLTLTPDNVAVLKAENEYNAAMAAFGAAEKAAEAAAENRSGRG